MFADELEKPRRKCQFFQNHVMMASQTVRNLEAAGAVSRVKDRAGSQWFSVFPMLPPLTQFLMLGGPPTIKLFSSLLYNCNFVAVTNHDVNIFGE